VLSSQEAVSFAWNAVKAQAATTRDIHQTTGKMANHLLHESMTHASLDNLTIIFVTFANFEAAVRQSAVAAPASTGWSEHDRYPPFKPSANLA